MAQPKPVFLRNAYNWLISIMMKNLHFFLVLIALTSAQVSFAQISSNTVIQNILCNGDTNGQIEFNGVEACFAPVTVTLDTLPAMTFSTLKNDGYTYINHGSGSGSDVGLGTTSASTSIGDVYMIAGWFEDSITFDTVTLQGNGAATSAFVACFDAANSNLLWADAATAGTGTYNLAYGADIIGDKAYVVGYFEGTTEFGSATIVSAGSYQGFIAKYDIPSGLIDTVIQVGNAGSDEISNIRAGADNRLYVTGDYTQSITLAGNSFSASGGGIDMFVTCFDSSLTTNYWGATGGGSGTDVLQDVVPYNSGGATEYAYVTGYFANTATLGSNSVTSAGNRDFLIAKVDTNGNWIWAESGGSSGLDQSFAIDINSTGDRLYVAGQWVGSMTIGSQTYISNGNSDGFIAYFDTTGTIDDLYQFGATGFDGVYDLQSIDDDYLVFAGGFVGSIDYADSTFTSNGGQDAFAGKIGPDQHEIWGKNFGGAGSNGDVFNSISAGPNANLHCAGVLGGDASAYQAGLVPIGVSDAIVTNETFMGTADTSIILSGLSAGEYYATMTDSNGNTVIDTFTIVEPDPISISGAVTNATSGASNDGEIDLTVTGGTPGYSYSWSNAMTTEDIVNLSIGTYTVTVTDTNGCTDTATFVIDTGSVVFSVTYVVTDLACGGDSSGSIDLTVAGGTTPYTFAWNTGATTEDLNGIAGGTYTVTVTDNDTNSFTETFVVNEPTSISISGNITPPTNGTSNDGAIDITVSGGTMPYSFAWSNAAVTEDISGLAIGNYSVTVTDSIGCTIIESFFVDTIPALAAVLVSGDVTCENTINGSIDLTVIGGVSPFTFAWSNGATTEDLSGLAAGVYTVTITDNASQSVTASDSVGSNPIFPDPIVGPINGPSSAQSWVAFPYDVPASNGSSFDWSATGGIVTSSTSNSAFVQWNAGPNGAVYVTETDANGCFATDSLVVDILFVGIGETHENAILVYPNPASEELNVILPLSFRNAQLALFSMSGQLVENQQTSQDRVSIDLSRLNPGIYILTLQKEDVKLSHRIVVK